jgi:hypothetical protein
LQKVADLIPWGWAGEDDSPMSRRDLSQPSFVEAMVSGFGKGGGFLDRIERAFDRSAFEAGCDSRFDQRRARLSAARDVQILLLQQWHTLSDPGAEEAVPWLDLVPRLAD